MDGACDPRNSRNMKYSLGLIAMMVVGCGGVSDPPLFGDGGENTDATTTDGGCTQCFDGTMPDDTGIDTGPTCEGLKCQQVKCDSGTTSVSGTVWDPAMKNPIYQVVVYVPNAKPDPITHGPKCDSCGGAAISGKPITTAITDAKGKFVLNDVPVGTNIPLVLQLGKWRRQITIANVQACMDNPISDKNQTRLPGKQSEGDMPLIALTGGCDPLHTTLQKMGIDTAEFTTGAGNGTVHVYAGQGGQNAGVNGASDAYAFWGNKATMMKYDMIVQECECGPYARDTMGTAYQNMSDYLDAGGRVLASHYQLNFFGSSPENGMKPPMSLQSAATWTLWGGSQVTGTFYTDTSFPKGKALDDWLENTKTASAWGTFKTSPQGQIATYSVGDINSAKMGISQRWMYPQGMGSVHTVSFNTPTTAMSNKRCGRVFGSDVHSGNMQLNSFTEIEGALEFVLFDLSACVIDDSMAPSAPPPM